MLYTNKKGSYMNIYNINLMLTSKFRNANIKCSKCNLGFEFNDRIVSVARACNNRKLRHYECAKSINLV